MAEFTYEAVASTGLRDKGTVTANSEREAMAILDGRGLFPLHIKPARTAASRISFGLGIGSRHLSTMFSELADLLHSGVPLLRSLDILERQSSKAALKEILRDVRAKVADGTSLADSMALHPRAFNELTVSMIRAGQEGGFLEDVLKRIAIFIEHQEDLKAKVIGAMAYPTFLLVFGLVVLNVLLLFFVPMFKPMFQDLRKQGKMPWLTEFLIGTSDFMWWHGWWLAILVLIGGVIFYFWARTPSGRLIVDGIRLRIPLVGRIYLSFALTRFTRILGTLLHNGIPILQALRIAKDSTGNKVLSNAIEQSAENITAGDSLATPLQACKHFPRDIVEMVSVAEESNTLETVLIDISEGLEKRTSRNLELFVRLLEPLMLLVMAGFTLIVVAGLLLPIFRMSSTIRGG